MNIPNNHNDKISKYLNGLMNSLELVDFEKEMQENPFLADAIEGYKNSGNSPEDLTQINSKLFQIEKKPTIKKWIYGFIIGGVAASIAIVLIYWISQNSLVSEPDYKKRIIIVKEEENHESTTESDTIIVIESENNNKKTYTAEVRNKPEKVEVPESISPLYLNKKLTIENDINANDVNVYYRYRSNHYYIYLKNYKIVDYRYSNRSANNIADLSSIFSDKYDGKGMKIYGHSEFAYMDVLEQAINKLDLKNYTGALADLNLIIDNFPDDANAIFYKAICLRKIHKNDDALRYFDLALKNKINTFHEEAKWHKSIILKEERQFAEAEKILQEIVYDNGYYGVHARKELSEIDRILKE